MSLFIYPLIAFGITIGIGINKEILDKMENKMPEIFDDVAIEINGIIGFLLSFIVKISLSSIT